MHMITVFKSWRWSFSLKWGSLDCSWKIRKKVLQLSFLEVFHIPSLWFVTVTSALPSGVTGCFPTCLALFFWWWQCFWDKITCLWLQVHPIVRDDLELLTFYTTTQCWEYRLVSLCWVMWCWGSKLGLCAYWASTLPLKLHPSSLCCCLDCCMSIHTAIDSGVALSMV